MPEKMILRADILAPDYVKILTFSGQNISSVLKIIPSLMKDVFKLESSAFYEDEMKWDTTGDPINFFGACRGREKKDQRTTLFYIVKIQGSESKKDKNGTVEVRITGSILTEFPYENPFQKVLTFSYVRFSYKEQRMKYIVYGRKKLEEFER